MRRKSSERQENEEKKCKRVSVGGEAAAINVNYSLAELPRKSRVVDGDEKIVPYVFRVARDLGPVGEPGYSDRQSPACHALAKSPRDELSRGERNGRERRASLR